MLEEYKKDLEEEPKDMGKEVEETKKSLQPRNAARYTLV